ncbi:hypothetical protein CP533_5855 [Ophiocordyceps camponoti-saundersi (nom. inval.)]|nr:hypothetical protein CP533_5855 [Ophiocordyceps camponoti-saundersi (nom. inval.)]
MGNLCGKEDPDPSPPGRVLGSAPSRAQQAPPSSSSSSVPAKVGGPPRKLGTSSSSTRPPQPQSDDARQRAAEAAEARAKAKMQSGGKLQRQLSAQQKQSRSNVLKQASEQDRRARDADDATSARNWD